MRKRVISISLALLMLLTLLPQGAVFAAEATTQAPAREGAAITAMEDYPAYDPADFTLGVAPSDMISGGGVQARSARGWLRIEDAQLLLEDSVLASGQLRLLNAIGDTVWFVQDDALLMQLSLEDGSVRALTRLGSRAVRELYVVNGEDFYFLTDDGVERYRASEDRWSVCLLGDLCSFLPTPYGFVYATGTLFCYEIYAADRLLISDADGWYADPELDGGSLVFTRDGETLQMRLDGAFDGSDTPREFTGYEIVCAEDLFTNLEAPDGDFPATGNAGGLRSATGRQVTRKTLSTGVQNIVKRAYQMTDIQWTPVADITGWGGGLTYKAGTTYTGLPYGQPVYASYVPWSTTLSGFIAAVNNGSSKMYTDQSTYNKVAPYYSCDCSAFVSWAWNLSSRQTTSSIPNFATKVSNSSYSTLAVGDALCNPGSHVVLVTDITYDGSGTITAIEISESTVNKATNYCCQKTWYGAGYSYALSKINDKYFSSGYSQYRSKTKDNATYAHVCEVPLAGDSCSVCGYGSYAATPVAATISVSGSKTTYAAPGGSSSGTVSAGNQSIVASCTVSGAAWYQLANGKWLPASSAAFVCYNTSVTIANKSFPSGRLQQGKSFPVVGDVTTVNPMTKITGSIYSGTTTTGTPVLTKSVTLSNATGYTLKSSAIDNALTFGSLANGQYTFLLEITERATCAGQSAQTLTWRETTVFTEGTSTSGGIVTAYGIDVSKYQGNIDWATVKKNVDFVIIRCGYGSDITSQDDPKWEYNASECERLGIPYGVYLFSYAKNTDMALSEANHVLRLLQGHSPSLPIYYDLEDSNTTGSLTNAQILAIAQTFCNRISQAGYTPGVYTMTSWWNSKLSDSTYNQWSRWVAQFASSCTYTGNYVMWQYSDSGSVGGISGNVDMDYWYADFPTVGGHTHSLSAVAAKDPTCTASGNIAYWYCAGCGKYFSNSGATNEISQAQTQVAALGHNYNAYSIAATCLQYEGVQYTCSRCGDSYTTYATAWSNWSTTRPTGVDESKIQSRTEYRYRDYTTKTSYSTSLSGYEQIGSTWERTGSGSVDYVATWPAGFQTSNSLYTTYHNTPVTASETETNKTVVNSSETIGYIYWHWCRGTYAYGPINRKTSTTQTSEFNAFHAFYNATAPSNYPSASDNSYNNPNAATCTDTYWYYALTVTRQNYSTYRKLFTYGKWGSWSSWGTTAYTADSTRQVETRTTYRYVTSGLGDHTWDNGKITTAPTCTATGVKTYTCTVCGTTKTETVAANGSHNFVNGVCTQCGLVQGVTSLAIGGRYVLITQQAKAADESYTATMELAGISTTSTKYGLAESYTDSPVGAYVLVIEQGTTAGTYAFRHGSGSYLAWSSGNSLKTVSGVTENSSWTVSFDGEGNATIANVADPTRILQFNASDPRFACYTGAQKPVKLLPFTCTHAQTTQVVTDPTCTEAGSVVTVCAACGEELAQQSTPALGHLWGSWNVTTAPTCAAEGVQTRTCSRCGASQTEAVPATGQHTYENGVCTVCHTSAPRFVPATSLQAGDRIIFVYLGEEIKAAGSMNGSGSSTYLSAVPAVADGVRIAADSALVFTVGSGSAAGSFTFENGGSYLSPSTAESGSNYVYLKSEAADWIVTFGDGTATVQSGSRELRYNTGSPRFSTYVSGQKEIMIYKEAADPAGCAHGTQQAFTVPATCTATGSQTVYCLLCGTTVSTATVPMLAHNYSYTVTKTPTRTAQGTLQGVCANCGDTITVPLPKFTAEGAYSYSVVRPSTCLVEGTGRYTWTETAYGTLYFDVDLPLGEHSYSETVTPPTCTTQGYTTHACSVCHTAYVDTWVPATGHSFNASGVCTVCQATAPTFVLASSIAEGDQIIFVYRGDATHEPMAAGMITGSGSKTYLDAMNVTLSGNTAVYGGLAIFTVEAVRSGAYRFKLGDDYLTPSTAESGSNYVYLEGSSADWTVSIEDGTANVHSGDRDLKYYYSSSAPRFSAYLSGQKDIAIYKLVNCDHSSTSTVTTPATCTADGLSVTVCTSCGAELSTTVIPAPGHNYQSAVTNPTCTAAGYTTHTCSRCGDSYTDTPTDALGHNYTDSVTDPTCTAQGYTTHTCSRCGDSYADTYTDPAGHSFVNGTCTACGARASNYVLASSIRDGDEVIFVYDGSYYPAQATPKAAGAVSNSRLSPVAVTLSGNSASNTNALVFTVVAGSDSGTYAFADSSGKYLYNSGSNTNVTLNAAETYWTVSFNNDSTANLTIGTRSLRYYYTSTSEYFNVAANAAKNVKIYKLGVDPTTCSHTNTVTQTMAATCTEAGSQITICADCGTQIGNAAVLPALGHRFTYAVTTEPTVSKTGKLTGTCGRCGATEQVTLPKLNDTDYSYSVVHAATCLQTGTGRYTWSGNGGFSFDVELPLAAHSYVDTVTPPTCTEQGFTTHRCSVCGNTVTDAYVAAAGHSFQNFVCTVCDAAAPNFVRVDSAANLAAGDQIILVYTGEHSGATVTKAVGSLTGSGNSAFLSPADAEVLYNAAASGGALVFTLEAGSNGTFRFKLGDKYLAPVKNGNDEYQNSAALSDTPTDWTVSIENGTANIAFDGRAIRFNYNSGNSRFAAYQETNSTMKQPGIYKRVDCAHAGTEEVEQTPATCTLAGSANVVCTVCGKILTAIATPALGHSYTASVNEPTCTEAGYTVFTCSRCGDTYNDGAVPALQHAYTETVIPPSCLEAGYTVHTCSRCGDSYTDSEVAALGHNYVDTITEPTCTADGFTTHVCSNCGDTCTDSQVAATGHSYDETGVCTVCGATAPNYVKTGSLRAGDEIIFVFAGDASGHEPRAAGAQSGTGTSAYLTAVDVTLIDDRAIISQALVFTVGTGSTAGTYTFRNGEKYLTAHATSNALLLQTEPADWTVTFTDGVPSLQCGERSLYYYSSNPRFSAYTNAYKPVLIYKLGVNPADCQHTNAQTVTVGATCTAVGSTTVTCPDCGTVLSAAEIPALGHDYVYAVTQQPTQTAQGRIKGTCSRCGATTATINIPRLNDSENYTYTLTQEATCIATGSERYALTGTDYAQYGVVIDLVIPMTPHSYVNGVCSVCGVTAQNYLLASSIDVDDKIIFVYPGDATHDPAAASSISGTSSSAHLNGTPAEILHNAVATSNALEFTVVAGETEGSFRFKNGDAYLVPGFTTTGNYANGVMLKESGTYDFDWTVTFEDGVVNLLSVGTEQRALRYNTSSGYFAAYVSTTSQKKVAIYKLVECEHTACTETVVTPATCTTAGLARTTCDTCGRIISERALPLAAHTPAEPAEENRNEPGCVTDGSYERVVYCSVCHEELSRETVAIPAPGHSYQASVTEPSCTAAGFTTYTCSRCGESYTGNETQMLGHNYQASVTEPSCTAGGFTTYTCSRCGDSYTGNETQMLGHHYQASVTEPTCTAAGFTTHTCSRCGDSYTDTPTDVLGHQWGEWTQTVAPGTDSTGEERRVCGRCGATETRSIPALGTDYLVSFSTPAGVAQPAAMLCNSNGSITLPTLTAPEGYSFLGWLTAAYDGAEQPQQILSGSYTATGNVTLFALFSHTEGAASGYRLSSSAPAADEAVILAVPDGGTYYALPHLENGTTPGTLTGTALTLENGYVTNADGLTWNASATGNADYPIRLSYDGSYYFKLNSGTFAYNNSTATGYLKFTASGDGFKMSNSTRYLTVTGGHAFKSPSSSTEDDGVVLCVFKYVEDPGTTTYTTEIPCTHSWGDWIVTTPAGCVTAGEETRTCSVCGQTETRPVDALDHSWGSWTVTTAAQVGIPGEETRTCGRCGATETREISALGATYTVSFSVPIPLAAQQPAALSCTAGESITLPALTAPANATFLGWTTQIVSSAAASPEVLTGSYTPEGDVTLNALFSYTVGASSGYRLTSDAPAAGDSVILAILDGETYYALPQLDGNATNLAAVQLTVTNGFVENPDDCVWSVQASGKDYPLQLTYGNNKYLKLNSSQLGYATHGSSTTGYLQFTASGDGYTLANSDRSLLINGHNFRSAGSYSAAVLYVFKYVSNPGATRYTTVLPYEVPIVDGVSLTPNGEIYTNAYLTIPDTLVDSGEVYYIVNGTGAPVRLNLSDKLENGKYRISVKMPAKEMYTQVTVQLVDKDSVPITMYKYDEYGDLYTMSQYTFCVHDYLDVVLAYADIYDAYYPGISALCKAISDYGCYAQHHFNYNLNPGTVSTPMLTLPETSDVYEAIKDTAKHSSTKGTNVRYYGASLLLESETTIRLYFIFTGSADGYLAYVDGAENGVELTRYAPGSSYYYFDITEIPAEDFATGHSVVVRNGPANESGTDSASVSNYSVFSYIRITLTDGSGEDLVNLVKSMWTYCQKAKTFFELNP